MIVYTRFVSRSVSYAAEIEPPVVEGVGRVILRGGLDEALDEALPEANIPDALQIETRGPTHCEEVLAKLREAGYPLALG